MLEKIFDLPVIVQGALGSFLFWLVFTIIKSASSYLSLLIGRFDKSWREESLEFEQLQSQYMVAEPTAKINYILLAMYGAANRALQGFVYFCMGAIANTFVEPIGLIGYGFAIIYFFRALKAIPFSVKDEKPLDWHHNRIKELQNQLDELRK